MNKFGLLEEESPDRETRPDRGTLSEKIASFSTIRPRAGIDLAAIDAAAAEHGFISREAPHLPDARPAGRRRRAIPTEPTRHLAIRLSASAYERFVAFADRQELTYHEALISLMDRSGE